MALITEMTLGDMFDRVFKLLGKTFFRNLLIGLVVFIPGAALVTLAMHLLIGNVLDLLSLAAPGVEPPDPDIFLPLIPYFGLLLLSILVLSAANVLAQVAMINIDAAEMTDQRLEWTDALALSSGVRWARALGASLLLVCALVGVYLVPIVLIVSGKAMLMVLGVLALIAALPLILYLYFRWLYIVPVIAWEDETAMGAFGRSSALVAGKWWRTFGIFLLFSIVFQFAASLIVTPISFIAMWGLWSEYFRILEAGGDSLADPAQLARMFSSFGTGYGIMIGLSSLLTTIGQCLYLVVMYFDARARRNEFQPPAAAVPADDTDFNAVFPG